MRQPFGHKDCNIEQGIDFLHGRSVAAIGNGLSEAAQGEACNLQGLNQATLVGHGCASYSRPKNLSRILCASLVEQI